MLVVDPIDTQGAFFHDTFIGIKLARAIGASPGTQLAADTDRLVDQHDAVLSALVGRAGRADGDAGRLLAMQTGSRKVDRPRALALAFLIGMDAVEPCPPGIVAIGVEI